MDVYQAANAAGCIALLSDMHANEDGSLLLIKPYCLYSLRTGFSNYTFGEFPQMMYRYFLEFGKNSSLKVEYLQPGFMNL